jgi:hypothetical protein
MIEFQKVLDLHCSFAIIQPKGKGSLSHSKDSATRLYPEPNECSILSHIAFNTLRTGDGDSRF